jgi:hypothetical protein
MRSSNLTVVGTHLSDVFSSEEDSCLWGSGVRSARLRDLCELETAFLFQSLSCTLYSSRALTQGVWWKQCTSRSSSGVDLGAEDSLRLVERLA